LSADAIAVYVTVREAQFLGWKHIGHELWLCPMCSAAAEPPSPETKRAKKVSPGTYVNQKTGQETVIGRGPTSEAEPVAEEPGPSAAPSTP
jgi:hypothetical protein